MFVVLAHAALARLVVDGEAAARPRAWLMAGFLAGLATSTQYYAIFIAFPMIGVALVAWHRSGRWEQAVRLLLWSVLGAAIGFLIGTPFLLFDLQKALSDIAHVREVDIDRAVGGGMFTAVGAYLDILLRDAVGWPVWIAAVVGAVWSVFSDWRRGLLVVGFFVPFFLFIANTVPMSRYLNVVLPMVALSAGFAVVRIATFAGQARNAVAIALVALAMTPGLISSIKTDLFIRQADTRTLARAFIESNIPAGGTLLVQPYSAPVHRSRESLVEALRANLGSESRASTKFQLTMALEPQPTPCVPPHLSRRRRRSRRGQDLRVPEPVRRERRRRAAATTRRQVRRLEASERFKPVPAAARGSARARGTAGGRVQPVPLRCGSTGTS